MQAAAAPKVAIPGFLILSHLEKKRARHVEKTYVGACVALAAASVISILAGRARSEASRPSGT
jgi:hypothetical protein